MTAVRIATRPDQDALMDLCRALHKDNGLFAMDDDMVLAMLNHAFDRKGGIIGVIGDAGRIEAAIYMLISHFWYSRDDHLEELFSFVRPEHRKSDHADNLLEFAKSCSDRIGIPLVIGVVTNTRMEAKVRMYRRKFGMPAGAFFVYGGKWTNEYATSDDLWRVHPRRRPRHNGDTQAIRT